MNVRPRQMFAVLNSTLTLVTTSPSDQQITVSTIMTSGEKKKKPKDFFVIKLFSSSRSTKQPLNVFKGHRKAVSYVKFLSSEDIVSASTDSQLKLWNVNQSHCARSFTGDEIFWWQMCMFSPLQVMLMRRTLSAWQLTVTTSHAGVRITGSTSTTKVGLNWILTCPSLCLHILLTSNIFWHFVSF